MSDQGDPNLNDQQFNIDSMNLLQGGNMNISTNVNISNIFKNQISNNQNTNIHNIHNPDSTNANNNQTNNNNNNNRQTNTYGHQACNLLDSFIPYPQNKNNEDQLNNVDITQSVIPQNYVNEKNQFSSNQENIQNNQNNNNNNNINNNNSNLNNNISNQSNNIPEYRDFFNNFENNNINNNQPVKKNSNSINQNANINNHNSNATNFDLESKQSARHFLNNFNSMAQQSNVSNFSMGNFELKNQFSVNQRGKVYQNQNFSNNLSVQNSYFGGENSEYRQPQMDYNFNSDLNNMRSRPLFQNEKSTNFNGNFNQINNNNNNNNLQQSNFATAGFSTILEGHKKMENMEISYPIQDSVFGHPHNIQNSMIISEQFQIQGSKIGASIFQTSEQNRIDQVYQQQNNFQQQQPQIFDSFMQPANHEQFRNKTDPNIDGSSEDDDDEDDEQQCENGNNTYIGIQMQSFSNEPFTQTNRYKTQTRYTQRVSNPNNKIYAKKSQKQEQGEQYQQQQQHQQQYEQQGVTKEEQKYNYQGQQYNMFNDQNNQNPDNQYQQQNQYQNNNDNSNKYNGQNLDKNQDLSNQIQEMPNLSEQEYNWPYTSNNSQKRQALAKNESKNKLKKQKLKDKQQKKAKLEEFSSNNEASNQNNMFSNNNNININKNLEEIGEDSSGSLSEEGKKKVALYTTVKTTQKTEIKTRNKDHKKKYRQSRHKNVFKNFGSALMRFIQYNQYFIEKKRSIFSDPELFPPINYEKLNLPIQSKHNEINQHIKNFDNWLKNQIRLERKTDFVQGWTWYESDSDEVCKFKDALRLLCYEFFENFALNYLMNSKKLDDLEIHLKSIFPFIAGINDPQTLERFKPK